MLKNVELKNQSVISGTMREADLVPWFLKFLTGVSGHPVSELIEDLSEGCQAAIYCWLMGVDDIELPDEVQEEMSYFLNEDLFTKMNEFAPEGYYFGSHPGDGSDYGFWEIDNDI